MNNEKLTPAELRAFANHKHNHDDYVLDGNFGIESQPVTVESLAEDLLNFKMHGIDSSAWLAHPKTSQIMLAGDWAKHWIMRNPTNQTGVEYEWDNIKDLIDITASIDNGTVTMTDNGQAAILLHNVEKLNAGALPCCVA